MIYMHRYYTKFKKNNTYEKRLTWLEPLHGLDTPQIAVVENKSQFPGHIPHGNSSKTNDFYIRTPVSTMTEIGKPVDNKAPKQLYDAMLLEGNIDTFPEIRSKFVPRNTTTRDGDVETKVNIYIVEIWQIVF